MHHRTLIQFLICALLGGDIAPVYAALCVTGSIPSLVPSGKTKAMGSPSRCVFRAMAMRWAPAYFLAMKHWGLRANA